MHSNEVQPLSSQEMRTAHRLLILAVIALGVRLISLPVFPLIDPTEGRYAVVASDMVRSGNWITPHIWIHGQRVPFLGKPPLHFWETAGAIGLLGHNEIAARLPSWLAAVLLAGIIGMIIRRYVDSLTAWLAVLLTVTSGGLFVLSGASVVDVTLTFFIASSLLAYYAFWREPAPALKTRWSLLVFGLLGLGFMTKGPICLLYFGAPVLLWTIFYRQWSLLKSHAWGRGIFLFLLIVTPWFILEEIRNPGFLKYFFWNENILRFTVSNYGDRYGHGHRQFFGAAIPMMAGMGAPWTLLTIGLLVRKRKLPWLGSFLKSPESAFFALPVLVNTGIWCFGRQFQATYFLPLVPLAAVWAALFLRKANFSLKIVESLAAVCIILCGLGCLALPFVPPAKSTREIGHIAMRIRQHVNPDAQLVWVRRVPYSAYFYSRDVVAPEPLKTDFSNITEVGSPENSIYIAMQRHYKRFTHDQVRRVTLLYADLHWIVFMAAKADASLSSAGDSRTAGLAFYPSGPLPVIVSSPRAVYDDSSRKRHWGRFLFLGFCDAGGWAAEEDKCVLLM